MAVRPGDGHPAVQFPARDSGPPVDGRPVHGQPSAGQGPEQDGRGDRAVHPAARDLWPAARRPGPDPLRRGDDGAPDSLRAEHRADGAVHRIEHHRREAGPDAPRQGPDRGRGVRLEDRRPRRLPRATRLPGLAVRPGRVRGLGAEVLGAEHPVLARKLGRGSVEAVLRPSPRPRQHAQPRRPDHRAGPHVDHRADAQPREAPAGDPRREAPVRWQASDRSHDPEVLRGDRGDCGVRASPRDRRGPRPPQAGDHGGLRTGPGHHDLRPVQPVAGAPGVRADGEPSDRRGGLERPGVHEPDPRRDRQRHDLRRYQGEDDRRAPEPLVRSVWRSAWRRDRHARGHHPDLERSALHHSRRRPD